MTHFLTSDWSAEVRKPASWQNMWRKRLQRRGNEIFAHGPHIGESPPGDARTCDRGQRFRIESPRRLRLGWRGGAVKSCYMSAFQREPQSHTQPSAGLYFSCSLNCQKAAEPSGPGLQSSSTPPRLFSSPLGFSFPLHSVDLPPVLAAALMTTDETHTFLMAGGSAGSVNQTVFFFFFFTSAQ